MNAPAAIQWDSQILAFLKVMLSAPFYPGSDTLRSLHREPATARDILSPSVFSHFSLDKPRSHDSLLVWSASRQSALCGNGNGPVVEECAKAPVGPENRGKTKNEK
jgi:hypothetical protein